MTRVNREVLIRVLAGIAGLIVAVVLTGCGDTGELGSEGEETTTAAPDETTEEGRTADPPAARDMEEETSEPAEEWTEEEEQTTDEWTDEWTEEEPAPEPSEEESEPDDPTEDDTEGDGDGSDGSSGEAYTFSGSGLTTSETAHLEGDYTVAFSVTGNTWMDTESSFMAFLTNADDEIDFQVLVDEIATETSGTTNVYGLDGDYYVDVMADGDWTFEFTPQ